MLYGFLADLVVVVHLAFMVFVGVGSFLAWRWRWLPWLHGPSLIWAGTGIAFGLQCPLTALETLLRRSAGEVGYSGGFVDRYVEGVVYPDSLTPLLHAVVFLTIVVGYIGLHRRRARRPAAGGRVRGMLV